MSSSIPFNLIEVTSNLYLVKIQDQYDQAMLFCRYCEWQESPYSNINHQPFKFMDLIKTYTVNNPYKVFDYMSWGGFNIPKANVVGCQASIPTGDRNVYDELMTDIANQISKPQWYLIGVQNDATPTIEGTYNHECCHGLYTLDSQYKTLADNITKTISPGLYEKMKQAFTANDYGLNVVDDEINAYMSTGPEFLRRIDFTTQEKKEFKGKKLAFVKLFNSYVRPKIIPWNQIP